MLYDLVERVVEAVRWDGEGNAGEGVIRLMGGTGVVLTDLQSLLIVNKLLSLSLSLSLSSSS